MYEREKYQNASEATTIAGLVRQ